MRTSNQFYKSNEWERLIHQLRHTRSSADGILYCEHCGKPLFRKYDIIAHHVIPLTDDNANDLSISLNPDNIRLVHHKCHNEIHERFGFGSAQRVYLVHGSPLCGKTTYVLDVAGKDDLIMDVDSIYESISVNPRFQKSGALKQNVFAIRDCILECIKLRVGAWRNAYIIGGYPLQTERSRLCIQLGAECIHIDTPQEECLRRLSNCTDRDINEWRKYIMSYWELFCE